MSLLYALSLFFSFNLVMEACTWLCETFQALKCWVEMRQFTRKNRFLWELYIVTTLLAFSYSKGSMLSTYTMLNKLIVHNKCHCRLHLLRLFLRFELMRHGSTESWFRLLGVAHSFAASSDQWLSWVRPSANFFFHNPTKWNLGTKSNPFSPPSKIFHGFTCPGSISIAICSFTGDFSTRFSCSLVQL